jgi:hypothetical protein
MWDPFWFLETNVMLKTKNIWSWQIFFYNNMMLDIKIDS